VYAVLSALAVAADIMEASNSNEPQQWQQLTANSALAGCSEFLHPEREVPYERNTLGTRILFYPSMDKSSYGTSSGKTTEDHQTPPKGGRRAQKVLKRSQED